MNLEEARKAAADIPDAQERADVILELVGEALEAEDAQKPDLPDDPDFPAGTRVASTHSRKAGTVIRRGEVIGDVWVGWDGEADPVLQSITLLQKVSERSGGPSFLNARAGEPVAVKFGTPSDARHFTDRYKITSYHIDSGGELHMRLSKVHK